MTFENLPPHWQTLPIDDPTIMDDVVDLVTQHSDRLQRSLMVLLCDETGRLLQPISINGLDRRPSRSHMEAMVSWLGHLPERLGGEPLSALFALAYPADRDLSVGDRQGWAQVIHVTCEAMGIRVLGVRLATVDRVGPLVAA